MTRRSSFFRIDENVFFTLSGALLLFLIVFGFRMATHTDCAPISIKLEGDGPYYAGTRISLTARSINANSFTWDFGDGTPEEKGGASIGHIYAQSRKYTVTVWVGKTCSQTYDIFIKDEPPKIISPILNSIECPQEAYMGKLVTFTDTDTTHTSRAWYAGDGGDIIGTGQVATHTYSSLGLMKVSLSFNNKDVIYRYINIIEDPVEKEKRDRALRNQGGDTKFVPVPVNNNPTVPPITPPEDEKKDEQTQPEKKEFPPITQPQMADMIKGYNEDKFSAADINKHFCDANTIMVNYEGKMLSLSDFLVRVKVINKGKIKNVKVKFKQQDSNCIQSIEVDIKRKFF